MDIHDNLCCQALRLFSLNQRYNIFMSAKKTKVPCLYHIHEPSVSSFHLVVRS